MHPTAASAPRVIAAETPSDAELLVLLHQDPQAAWKRFIDRHADSILSYLRALGFSTDEAMDRFVYVCEKLWEDDFRRLKTIQYAGRSGDLTPWLRQVVKNLSINWAWSVEGRRRLFKSIRNLPPHEQRIFELYFWRGLEPAAIQAHLQIDLLDVVDALERIFSRLSHKKMWRLLTEVRRRVPPASLEAMSAESGFEPTDLRAGPEETLIARETNERLRSALAALPPRQRLVVQLRYENAMSNVEIAEVLSCKEREVKTCLRNALQRLRQFLSVE